MASSCDIDIRCGTGSGSFAHPDDPDLNNSVLIAKPAFGGIDLTWTYPEYNAHAVSHTVLYRSRNSDPNTKINHALVNGTFFYDRVPEGPTLYYYWIQFVSINGTVGPLIGPSSATSRGQIEETIESLTGQITNGMLAPKLKGIIGAVGDNETAIAAERYSRIEADGSLSLAFSDLEINLGDVRTALIDTQEEFRSADQALVNTVEGIYAQTEENHGLILEEQTVRATETEALAQSLTTVEGSLKDSSGTVQTNIAVRLGTTEEGLAEVESTYTTVVEANGLIGGFGIGNDGTTVEAGFNVDRFWVGKLNEQGIVEGGKLPFIIDGESVYINEAAINSLAFNKLRNEDNSVMVTEPVYDQYNRLVTPSKLKAEYIDAEHITVGTSNVKGLGTLASEDSINYSDLGGSKPPTDADKTSDNTAYDTERVNGEAAKDISEGAKNGSSAKDRTDAWTKSGTTKIDGGMISADEAWIVEGHIDKLAVNTLHIRDNAVTVPVYAELDTSRYTLTQVGGQTDEDMKDALTISATFNEETRVVFLINIQAMAGYYATNVLVEIWDTDTIGTYPWASDRLVYRNSTSTQKEFAQTHFFMHSNMNPAGTNTWKLKVGNNWGRGQWTAQKVNFFVLGAQK